MTKPQQRDLSAVEAELTEVLKRGTADIIKSGELLYEAKSQVKHGEWKQWLGDKFSLSERSAQKYMRAYKWASKNAPGADFGNLSPSAIYSLSITDYSPETIATVLQEAKVKRVGYDRLWQIHSQHELSKPKPEPQVITINGQKVDPRTLGAVERAQLNAEAWKAGQAEAKPEPAPEPEPNPKPKSEPAIEPKSEPESAAASKPEPTVPTIEEFAALKAAAKSEAEERRRAAARSHPRNASVDLKLFLNACYHFVPGLNEIELAKAEEIFKQCAKEAKKRAAKGAAA
jgi:Protein of unknown function (DUF3102)